MAIRETIACLRNPGRILLACILSQSLPAHLAAQPIDAATPITEVTLARDCFGCESGSVLALKRDGTAIYTVTGHARFGTIDKLSIGRVRVEDFDRLAVIVVSEGFFELADQYGNARLQDGSWTEITVARDGKTKRVVRRNDPGPAALQAVERAIEDVKARIDFTPPIR